MVDKYTLQAREMVAVEYERQGFPTAAKGCRNRDWDGDPTVIVPARILREQAESQPTFEQRLKAMEAASAEVVHSRWPAASLLDAFDRHLAEIMAPPVDPLVAAAQKVAVDQAKKLGVELKGYVVEQEWADNFRKALADRGLEIREVQG